jgi:hypothetical protein
VPVIPPIRPVIYSEPFSTYIVLNRRNIPLAERFFLYPIHVSLSFLLTKGINSAVYLMLLRLLHREYAEVFRLADSIATDTTFNTEGLDIFKGAFIMAFSIIYAWLGFAQLSPTCLFGVCTNVRP